MSDDNETCFPGVQVSTFIKGDQYVFRGKDGDELKELLVSVAGSVDPALEALNSIKQAVLGKGVLTGDSANGGSTPAKTTAATGGRRPTGGRAKDSAPPSGDYESYTGEDGKKYVTVQCKHGDMADLRGRGFKSDFYCTLDVDDYKLRCKPVSA